MVKFIEEVQSLMEKHYYICDRPLATVIYLALKMEKPLFLEGQAGVGKTDVAKVMALGLSRRLIRLQCYEGLDVNSSVYEWNYPKQLLKIQLDRQCSEDQLSNIFSEEFMIKRPLLEAIQCEAVEEHIVLLIDELDRSDEEFEAFLLEILSDWQISIPEIGTLKAKYPPFVVLTSNRTREINDALKRRCLYYWIDYPSFEKEYKILTLKVPGINDRLAKEICNFMQKIRNRDYLKPPGIAETLDWAQALTTLHKDCLNGDIIRETLGCIFKYHEDIERYDEQPVYPIQG